MSKMMTTISQEELAHLEARVRKSAMDKSYLQLVIRLMNRVSAASGLDDAIDCMLHNILDVVGGANIILYYLIDGETFYVDVYGKRMRLDRIDDELVRQVFVSHEAVELEHAFADTKMTTAEFTKAYTWVYPLLVGPEPVGVFKMESLHIGMNELYQHLPTFFNFAAHVLKNMRADKALRESEEKYRTLVDNLNTGVYRATGDRGRIIQANPALARIFGFDSVQEFMKTSIADLYRNPEERTNVITEIRRSGTVKNLELAMRKKDGTPIWCSFTSTAQFDDDHDVTWVDGVVEDITARREAAEAIRRLNEELEQRVVERTDQLETANADLRGLARQLEGAYNELKSTQARLLQQDKLASIGQLAAGVAHEINNPMGFVISNLTSLGRYVDKVTAYLDAIEQFFADRESTIMEYLLQERKRYKIDLVRADLPELIRESLEGAERVRRIVQDLKSFSRVDSAECGYFDLNDGLDSTLSIVWNELKYKAVVEKDYARLPQVWCNLGQLNQVFMNLLVNAAQAIPEQGTIRIKTWADGECIRIAVSDTGCGMRKETLQRIFDPFFTTKEVGQGTGLGLAIAYDIVVNKHGGTISVTSEVDTGTTFTIMLPIRRGVGQDDENAATGSSTAGE